MLSWFESNPPGELVQWWEKEGYRSSRTEDQVTNRSGIQDSGSLPCTGLPEAGWWENFYVPMLDRLNELRKIHGGDPALAAVLDTFDHEIDMYRKYKRYYGYTFFVMQNEG